MSRSLTTLEFSAMVQQYQSLVYTVCHQLVPDVGDAQDLTQETLLAAWRQVLDTLGAEELTRMILDLREPYKTPCRLVLLEQHTMAEAARLCGRPEKTVNAQIYRAKKMLVQQIREQQEGRSVHGTV